MTCFGEMKDNVHAKLDQIAQKMFGRNYCMLPTKEKRLIIAQYSKEGGEKDVKAQEKV